MLNFELSRNIVAAIRTSIAHEDQSDGSLKLLIPEDVIAHLKTMIYQQVENLDVDPVNLAALMSVIILIVESGDDRETSPVPKGGLSTHLLKRVINHIDTHISDRLTIRQLAAIAGLSRSHFGYAFRQSTALTPREFILHRRIALAKVLLSESSSSIANIALAVGFANQSHLTAHFRRITGLTPGAFRRRRVE